MGDIVNNPGAVESALATFQTNIKAQEDAVNQMVSIKNQLIANSNGATAGAVDQMIHQAQRVLNEQQAAGLRVRAGVQNTSGDITSIDRNAAASIA